MRRVDEALSGNFDPSMNRRMSFSVLPPWAGSRSSPGIGIPEGTRGIPISGMKTASSQNMATSERTITSVMDSHQFRATPVTCTSSQNGASQAFGISVPVSSTFQRRLGVSRKLL